MSVIVQVGVLFLLLACAGNSLASPAKPAVLHSIQEIYGPGRVIPGQTYSLAFDAVVTYSDGEWGQLFVRDETGNTFLDVRHGSPTYPLGALVHVEGNAVAEGNSVRIMNVVVRFLKQDAPPHPISVSVAEIEGGAAPSSWAVTQGVLRPCMNETGHVCFRLLAGSKMMYVSVRQSNSPAAQKLIGAVVRIRGVVAGHLDAQGKRDAAQLFTDSLKEIEVLSPALNRDTEPIPIHHIAPEDANLSLVQQVHIRGRIVWRYHGEVLVRDASGAIFLRVISLGFLQTGDTVDVIGFPANGERGVELADAEMNLALDTKNSVSLTPLRLPITEVYRGSYQGQRVDLHAHLVSQTTSETGTTYLLRDQDLSFKAICLSTGSSGQSVEIPRGSNVELMGVAWMQSARKNGPPELTVLLQSPMDILVRREENWLTWQRAIGILGVFAVCMLAPLAWIKQLRRTVRKQTDIILQNYESKLQMETRYRRVIERNLAAVFIVDASSAILECNAALANMLGVARREELIGRHCSDFDAEGEQDGAFLHALQEEMLSNWETSLRRVDGEVVHLMMNITPIDAPEGKAYEITAIDITQLRQNQLELQKAKDAAVFDSLNDALTGLPNRRYLQEVLPSFLQRAKVRKEVVVLLFIDLDEFKIVNDSLGHAVGDALLVQTATSLRSIVRQGDTLARLGGDEFMVILSDIHDKHTAMQVAESLLNAVSMPHPVDNHLLQVGASIGISIYPSDSRDAEELVHYADCAMYAAKRAGKNRICHFSKEMENLVRGA